MRGRVSRALRASLGVLALVGAAAACVSAPPATAEAPPPPVSSAPSGAPSAASVVPAASTPPAAFAASSAPQLAPPAPLPAEGPLVALFTKGKSVVYVASDVVDTHDPRPGKHVAKTTARVTFTVESVEPDAGSWLATGVWVAVPKKGGDADAVLDAASPPSSWRLRGDALEIGDDADHVVLVTRTALRSAGAEASAARASGERCHESKGEGMYGPTRRELCFDALGLVRYIEENLRGPRQFTLVRATR